MAVPVVLYTPNILCYFRIILAFVGFSYSTTDPVLTCWIWIASAALDLFDGILARKLNQMSSFGVLLDIAADNILRNNIWISAAIRNEEYRLLAAFFISLEWITMICTQLHASQSGNHWKSCRENDPKLLQMIFANNFKTPIGTLCVYGLFGAGMFVYGADDPIFVDAIPFFYFFKYASFLGRGLTVIAELWLCKGYLSLVIAQDVKAKGGESGKDE